MVLLTSSLHPASLSSPRNRTTFTNVVTKQSLFARSNGAYRRRIPFPTIRASISTSQNHEPNNVDGSRIMFSDVVVKKKYTKPFSSLKWSQPFEIVFTGSLLLCHVLCLFAPFTFNWAAFWVAVGLYVVTGLFGITLCFHRNLTHKSYKVPKWLEYIFAYCGVLAGQMDPIYWVGMHRYHHQHVDTDKDPHSPIEGLWFSHLQWSLDHDYVREKCGELDANVGDLKEQPFYRFIQQTYFLHMLGIAVPLYALGGIPFVVWGLGVRIVWVLHVTMLVNSASHIWGNQAWKTGDHSRNNWWVALLTFGEGWHNNHHAFEYSARHGLEWWQFDATWYVIKFLETIGLATDVKLPTEAHKQKLAL